MNSQFSGSWRNRCLCWRFWFAAQAVVLSAGLVFFGVIAGEAPSLGAAPPDNKPAPLVQTIGVLSVEFNYERTTKIHEQKRGAYGETSETWTACGRSIQRVLIRPTSEVPSIISFSLGALPDTDPSPGGDKNAEYAGHYTYDNQHHQDNGTYVNEHRTADFDIQSSDKSNPDAIHATMESSDVGENLSYVRFLVAGNYTVKSDIEGMSVVYDDAFHSKPRFVPVSNKSQQTIDLAAQHEFDPAWPADYATADARKAHESSCNLFGTFPQALSCSGAKTTYSPKQGWTVTFNLSQNDPKAKTTTENGGTTSSSGSEKITLTARLIPGNPAPAKMIIAPNDATAYDNWLPIPASDDPAVQKVYGNSVPLSFTATIQAKDPGRDPPPGTIDFYLRNVSHNQGKCGNDPRPGAGGGDSGSPPNGLRFAQTQPAGITIDADDPTHAFTADLVTRASVIVQATDTGAYGRLYAQSQELGLNATYERTGQLFVDVPRDDDENHIAYAWEKAQHILGERLAANSDAEDQPFPDNKKGDGISLYDQYRGFIVRLDDGKGNPIKLHQRIDLKSKNLFVMIKEDDQAAALLRTAVEQFGAITGFAIHFLYHDTGLGFDDSELGKSPYPHWLNYNSDPDLAAEGCPRQYAVWIISKPPPTPNVYGRTVPIPPFNDDDCETPRNVDYIGVYRANAASRFDWVIANYPSIRERAATQPTWFANTRAAWDKLHAQGKIDDDFPAIAAYLKLNETALIDQFDEFCVFHELGHATGLQHHHLKDALQSQQANVMSFFAMGDRDCPMRYWIDDLDLSLLEFDGKWNPEATAPDGTPWKFCEAECRPKFRLRD